MVFFSDGKNKVTGRKYLEEEKKSVKELIADHRLRISIRPETKIPRHYSKGLSL